MKQLIFLIILLINFILTPQAVMAESVAAESAKITNQAKGEALNKQIVKKRMVLQKMLTGYNSPLAKSVDAFITTCVHHELDCYLLPSITGLESTFGKFIHPNSYNPFGWGGGYIMFENWDKAIFEVGRGLKENYIAKGADTVDKIAPIYAASTTWAPRVKFFMNKFEEEEQKLDSILTQNEVKL